MIEINNLTTFAVDEKFLKKIAQKVLRGEKKRNKNLSVALIGEGRIRELNKKYRKKSRVTDVLAFPEIEIGLPARITAQGEAGGGEIVICLREVKKNSQKYKKKNSFYGAVGQGKK